MKARNPLFIFSIIFAFVLFPSAEGFAEGSKVYIGLNAEIGHISSTSDDAVKQGMLIAIDEINRAGGVLGGRKLELLTADNRAVPARAIANNKEFIANKDLVAVFCGKFSSAVIESLPLIHESGLPLLDPWAANDKLVDNGYTPNYAFRLSLKDSWAIPVMLGSAEKRGFEKVGLLLLNTSWGRNNLDVIKKYTADNDGIKVTDTQWFNYGDKSFRSQYDSIKKSGAKAIILVAIETEAAHLIKEIAQMPEGEKLPVISHWSVTGGDFPALTGDALQKVDLSFVQTFDLHVNKSERASKILNASRSLFGIKDFSEVKSPCGLAHAYDLTHILARAINAAGSTDRAKIRNALEQVKDYDGLIRHYSQPFSASNHEALAPENVFMARYGKDGLIRRSGQ